MAKRKNSKRARKGKQNAVSREYWILRCPRPSSFWVPRNLSHHMIRQARTGDTVLVKSREMTGRTQTLPWWLRGEGIKNRKTTENKIHWPRSLWYILKANQYCRRKPTAFVCSGRQKTWPLLSRQAQIRNPPNDHYKLQRTVVKKTRTTAIIICIGCFTWLEHPTK